MATKTIRSRSNREVGQLVEGCKIIAKTVVIAPVPSQKIMGVYDYEVEAPVTVCKPRSTTTQAPTERLTKAVPSPASAGTRREVSEAFFSRRVGSR